MTLYINIIYYVHIYYLNATGVICFNLFALKCACIASKCDNCLLHGSKVGIDLQLVADHYLHLMRILSIS